MCHNAKPKFQRVVFSFLLKQLFHRTIWRSVQKRPPRAWCDHQRRFSDITWLRLHRKCKCKCKSTWLLVMFIFPQDLDQNIQIAWKHRESYSEWRYRAAIIIEGEFLMKKTLTRTDTLRKRVNGQAALKLLLVNNNACMNCVRSFWNRVFSEKQIRMKLGTLLWILSSTL